MCFFAGRVIKGHLSGYSWCFPWRLVKGEKTLRLLVVLCMTLGKGTTFVLWLLMRLLAASLPSAVGLFCSFPIIYGTGFTSEIGGLKEQGKCFFCFVFHSVLIFIFHCVLIFVFHRVLIFFIPLGGSVGLGSSDWLCSHSLHALQSWQIFNNNNVFIKINKYTKIRVISITNKIV